MLVKCRPMYQNALWQLRHHDRFPSDNSQRHELMCNVTLSILFLSGLYYIYVCVFVCVGPLCNEQINLRRPIIGRLIILWTFAAFAVNFFNYGWFNTNLHETRAENSSLPRYDFKANLSGLVPKKTICVKETVINKKLLGWHISLPLTNLNTCFFFRVKSKLQDLHRPPYLLLWLLDCLGQFIMRPALFM